MQQDSQLISFYVRMSCSHSNCAHCKFLEPRYTSARSAEEIVDSLELKDPWCNRANARVHITITAEPYEL